MKSVCLHPLERYLRGSAVTSRTETASPSSLPLRQSASAASQTGKGRGEGSLLPLAQLPPKNWLGSFTVLKLTLILLLALPALARGHDPGLSSVLINLREDRIQVTLTFARKDAEQLAHAAAPPSFGPEEQTSKGDQDSLVKLVRNEFRLECDHRRGTAQEFTIRSQDPNNTSISWIVRCERCSSLKIESSLLRHLPPGHRQYLAVQIGETQPMAERLLSAQDDAVEFAIPRTVVSEPPTSSAISFLQLGIKHILTGYDHLLFLFGLLLVTKRFSSALRIITCFTIAHSITLALATLSPVPAPPRLVEPLIAASIVYVGVENLARGGEPKGRWLLTFIFGLIHGCGFASALRELGIGAGGHGVAVPLICFNGGVELGQLMITAILLPLIWKAQSRPAFVQRFVPVSSAAVVLLGGYWLVQRMLMS